MAKGKYLLTLDAGTGAGRCVIFDLSGAQVTRAYREWSYFSLEGLSGAWEFSPHEFWSILVSLVREALSASGIDAGDIAAVACTSQRQGLVLLGQDGRELKGIPNSDRRAPVEGRALGSEWGKLFYGTAGRWPNDLHPASKLLWLKKNEPRTWEKVSTVLTMSDWMNFRLSGEMAAEPTGAAETCFMDVCVPEWWAGFTSTLGLPPGSLPPLRRAGDILGGVTAAVAADSGLKEGLPVIVAGADTQCGSLGAGAVDPGQVAVIAGTSTPVHLVTASAVFDLLGRTLTNCHLIHGRWILESNALITGQTYRWLRDLCFRDEAPGVAFEVMDREAAMVPPGSAGVQAFAGASIMDSTRGSFLPRGGIMFPLPLSQGTGRGALARGLLESYAFAVRANLEQLSEISGMKFERVLGGGQGTSSRLWTEIVASVTGLPVLVPRVKETTALGAAMCAAAGIGACGSLTQAAKEMGVCEDRIDPESQLGGFYEEAYQEWVKTYARLKEVR